MVFRTSLPLTMGQASAVVSGREPSYKSHSVFYVGVPNVEAAST